MNADSVPVYMLWIKYLSWFSYSSEILMINQWDSISNLSCSSGEICPFENGADVMNYMSANKSNWGINFGALVILFVGFRVLAFFGLLLRTYKKK